MMNRLVDRLLVLVALTVVFIAMYMLMVFGDLQLLEAVMRIETQFYYLLLLLLLPFAFLIYGSRPVIDSLLALTAMIVMSALLVTAEESLDNAWEFGAPEWMTYLCLVLWL